MKNKLKSLGISLLIAGTLMFTGCSSTAELNEALVPVESKFDVAITEMYDNLNNMDGVALRDNIEEYEQMIEDLTIARAEYEQGSDEYKMFSEFITVIKYAKEIAVMAVDYVDNPLGAVFEAAIIEEKVNTYTAKYSEALDNYVMYKEKLGLDPYVAGGTEEGFNIEEQAEEAKVEDNKEETKEEPVQQVEEKKAEEKVPQTYCEWCEANVDHNSNDHIGQCYDCGKEMKASKMTFNGRSFHCGCVCQECGRNDGVADHFVECSQYQGALEVPEEELYVCPGCDGSFHEDDMIEETQNGIMYCYSCYDRVMNDIMGGDANGDLEEWEY